ncbi:hypothetical protein IMG5_099490 [Ichthyophthirius multifiliis]|uniref:Anaphase-promoting complex subunit 4 WD40 domain-containing protein n=1 Tax=Ichthyophthirius multifiliis TaxID=5932 RepID=G0QS56_ICHMU|nr:hypothetical protein IMG5_099490 [Ichthyophthirius multifiliis]EGR31921.1 hypothetical protein IMG5_099490 [Ichthyophthirius multifiliis]|eukprot:XP_004035407.1 hypothetical protein IMG5_099490 [Ichthyophthirius multifiliis]
MSTKTFLKHTDFVSTLNFHPQNPNIFISGGGDDIARTWDINNPDKPLIEIPKQNETIDFAKFNFDGSLFVTGALDGSVKVWTSNGEFKKLLEGPTDEIRFLNWHPKGNVVIAGSADNSVWMWNAISGQYMSTFTGHQQPLTCGQFSPDGNLILTASEDASVRIWKPKTGELIKKISGFGFHQEQIVCFDIHPVQCILASGSVDKIACISNYQTGKVLGKTIEHDDGVESVLFDSKLDIFYTGSLDGFARIFDLNKMTLKDKISVEHSVTKMIFLKEYSLLVVGNCNGEIHYFDHRKKGIVGKLTSGSSSMLYDLVQYQQNKFLASFDDGAIKLFEL